MTSGKKDIIWFHLIMEFSLAENHWDHLKDAKRDKAVWFSFFETDRWGNSPCETLDLKFAVAYTSNSEIVDKLGNATPRKKRKSDNTSDEYLKVINNEAFPTPESEDDVNHNFSKFLQEEVCSQLAEHQKRLWVMETSLKEGNNKF